ncbi:hypothetical protein GCM10009665_79150 [Kitasatospora nipponensis]|uniref:AMP-dependent synthetase/ligase domain-containing protein n=1 Tax=Kitasatospora nipponensis TaxID=258049 RepID=A0ABN1TB60_9ACTN
MIYTSGSTGRPKGVMIEHHAALNTVLDINERFQVGPDDRLFGLADLGFDLSVYDLFGSTAARRRSSRPPRPSPRPPPPAAATPRERDVRISGGRHQGFDLR